MIINKGTSEMTYIFESQIIYDKICFYYSFPYKETMNTKNMLKLFCAQGKIQDQNTRIKQHTQTTYTVFKSILSHSVVYLPPD